jgi:hypothetical protein
MQVRCQGLRGRIWVRCAHVRDMAGSLIPGAVERGGVADGRAARRDGPLRVPFVGAKRGRQQK